MNEEFVVVHYNGSESGWVESGPYVDGWYETREQADAAAATIRSQEYNGWNSRVAVMTAEEYYSQR